MIKIEGRRGARFLVGGPNPADRQVFHDARAAAKSFEDVERGVGAGGRRPKQRPLAQRVGALLPAPRAARNPEVVRERLARNWP
jgi:hypothetical protein